MHHQLIQKRLDVQRLEGSSLCSYFSYLVTYKSGLFPDLVMFFSSFCFFKNAFSLHIERPTGKFQTNDGDVLRLPISVGYNFLNRHQSHVSHQMAVLFNIHISPTQHIICKDNSKLMSSTDFLGYPVVQKKQYINICMKTNPLVLIF